MISGLISTIFSSGFSPFEQSITAILRADADLRRRQPDALGRVHRLEHIFDQLVQLRRIELGDVSASRSSTGSPYFTIG